MPTPLSRAPAEGLAAILRWLTLAVDTRGLVGRLANPLVGLIIARIRTVNQHFARLAARVAAGRYVPRSTGLRRERPPEQPRRQNPLPREFGWLLALVPEAVGYRSQLEHLLQDPAMAALIAAAPAPMARILRPLCWMLRLRPPPILAPGRPASPPAPDTAPRTVPPPPPIPQPARSARPAPPAPTPARACGPPHPLPA